MDRTAGGLGKRTCQIPKTHPGRGCRTEKARPHLIRLLNHGAPAPWFFVALVALLADVLGPHGARHERQPARAAAGRFPHGQTGRCRYHPEERHPGRRGVGVGAPRRRLPVLPDAGFQRLADSQQELAEERPRPAHPRQRGLVGARPLHLAGARPSCRLKSPLGTSLLRKRGL